MAGFLIAKNGDHFVISSTGPLCNYILGDEGANLNNAPFLIANNKYGKVVIVYPRGARLLQLLKVHLTSLIKHNEQIDYNYIKYVFFPKFVKLIGDNSNLINKNSKKRDSINVSIGIVAEDKAYYIREDGYIKEQDFIGSTQTLECHLFSMKDDYQRYDEKFLSKVLLFDHIQTYELIYAMYNLSTSDYKINYLPVIREELLNDSDNCN